MTQIIRVFESGPEASKAANAAADQLRAGGFGAVRVASLPAGGDDRVAAARAALSNAGFSPAEAEGYAPMLGRGGALLAVEAPFGRGTLAEQIIDRFGTSRPVPALGQVSGGSRSKRAASKPSAAGDQLAAPLSTLLNLPVLLDPRPSTVNALGDQRPTFPVSLLRSDFYFSRLLRLPLLIAPTTSARLLDDPAPLSHWLGLPVLLRGPRRPAEEPQEEE